MPARPLNADPLATLSSRMSHPLDYVSPDTPRSPRRWPWRVLVAAVVLLVGVLSVPSITFRQVRSEVDPVTGSMRWTTVGLTGVPSPPRVAVSPLELRLSNMGVQWTRSWHTLHNTHYDMFGRPRMWECSSAPPIYTLRPVLNEFAAAASDEELRAFVGVMESGSEAEQQATVDAAAEMGLKAMSAVPAGG